MKSDKEYFAEVQASIIKQVSKLKPKEVFARWEINLDGYDYSLYTMKIGAVGYIIPLYCDFLSGIESVVAGSYGNAPEFVNNLVCNTELVDCHIQRIEYRNQLKVVTFTTDNNEDSMTIRYKFFEKFNKEEFSYKCSRNKDKIALYIYRNNVLVALIMALRAV